MLSGWLPRSFGARFWAEAVSSSVAAYYQVMLGMIEQNIGDPQRFVDDDQEAVFAV